MISSRKPLLMALLLVPTCALGGADGWHGVTPAVAFAYCGETPYASYRFTVDRARLQYTPAWRAQDPNPPVSARAALTNAGRALMGLVKYPKAWVRTEISLVRFDATDSWYWKITYMRMKDRHGKDAKYYGKLSSIPIIVLMDGHVVQPASTIGDCKLY